MQFYMLSDLLHFVGFGADDQRKQLVSQTDAEDRLRPLNAHHLPHVSNSGLAELRVSWAVADEQAIVVCWWRQCHRADSHEHQTWATANWYKVYKIVNNDVLQQVSPSLKIMVTVVVIIQLEVTLLKSPTKTNIKRVFLKVAQCWQLKVILARLLKQQADLHCPGESPRGPQWPEPLAEQGSESGCTWCRSPPPWCANSRWGWRPGAPEKKRVRKWASEFVWMLRRY